MFFVPQISSSLRTPDSLSSCTVKKAIVISTSHLLSEFKMSEHVTRMNT